jgi:ABC-type sulfate transport system permease component
MATSTHATPRMRPLRLDKLASRITLLAFVLALGYLTVLPLVRLQIKAFSDGGRSYDQAFTRPGAWETVRYTIQLGLGSLLIALVLGTTSRGPPASSRTNSAS